MKILVLGHKGMLGHMVVKYMSEKNQDVLTTDFRWPNQEFKELVINFSGDYIVNCIGAIHQRTNKFEINWELPQFLDANSKCPIVHPGTDCEMDLDDYGKSKKIARDFIVNNAIRTKSIKTSIIGPELNTKASLMEWFLSQPDNSLVKGYSECYWNGNTTLTWAEFCFNLINNWEKYNKETIISSHCISKYDILVFIKDIYNKNIEIEKNSDIKINKCLLGDIKTHHISKQLQDLKKFTEKK